MEPHFEAPWDWDGITNYVAMEVAKSANPPSEAELRASVTAHRALRDSPTVVTADIAEKAEEMITAAEDTVMSQVEAYNASDAGKAMPQSTAAWTGAMACLQVCGGVYSYNGLHVRRHWCVYDATQQH